MMRPGGKPGKEDVRAYGSQETMMEERLLTVDEAAEILKTSTDWLYRHWKRLPFTVQLSPRQIRFSLRGIYRYIEEKQNAGSGVSEG